MKKGKKEKGRPQGFFQSDFWMSSRKHVFTKINWCRICLCGYCDTPVISLLLFIKASEHDHRIKPIKSNSSRFPHLWDESHTVNNEEWMAEINSWQSICLAGLGTCSQTRCSTVQLDARSLSGNKKSRLQLPGGGLHPGEHRGSGATLENEEFWGLRGPWSRTDKLHTNKSEAQVPTARGRHGCYQKFN